MLKSLDILADKLTGSEQISASSLLASPKIHPYQKEATVLAGTVLKGISPSNRDMDMTAPENNNVITTSNINNNNEISAIEDETIKCSSTDESQVNEQEEPADPADEQAKEQPDPDNIKMFVGQIPKSMDEVQLKQMFENFGRVHTINVLRDKITGISKGCCFVTYFTRKAALRAQDALHNIKTLEGVNAPSRPDETCRQ